MGPGICICPSAPGSSRAALFDDHLTDALQGLLDWYGGFRDRPRVALVHGEPPAMDTLAEKLRGLQAKVWTPEYGARLDLHDYRMKEGGAHD